MLLCPWDSPGKNTRVGCHFLLQGSSQNRDQAHISWVYCIGRQILYHWAISEVPLTYWWWYKVAQSCPTLCNSMDCSLRGSSISGIFQARVPEWVAISFSLTSPGQIKYSSITQVISDSLWPHGLQHARPPCPSPTPGVYSNSHPLSQWCHPVISSSVIPFSSCLQSFPASGSFPVSQLFTSCGQSIGVSSSASVLPMNIQNWFPLR